MAIQVKAWEGNKEYVVDVRHTYYYVRPAGITVCIAHAKGAVLARGISICSPLDQFCKATGRTKAFGRMIQAIENQDSQPLQKVRGSNYVLSAYLPEPNEIEERLIDAKNKSRYQEKNGKGSGGNKNRSASKKNETKSEAKCSEGCRDCIAGS